MRWGAANEGGRHGRRGPGKGFDPARGESGPGRGTAGGRVGGAFRGDLLRSAQVRPEAAPGTALAHRDPAVPRPRHRQHALPQGACPGGQGHHPLQRRRYRLAEPAQHGPQVRERRGAQGPRPGQPGHARGESPDRGDHRQRGLLRRALRPAGSPRRGNQLASGGAGPPLAQGPRAGRGAGDRPRARPARGQLRRHKRHRRHRRPFERDRDLRRW